MAENTFLGLQPYTEDDAYRFKGRTEESQELYRLIVRNDFTVCYAESGEGKTSLLNAGVFPLLRENMYFPIAITFTSDDYKVTPDNFDTIIDRCIKDSIAEYNEKNKGVNVEYALCSTDFEDLNCQAVLQRELSKYSWWKLRNYKPQAMGLTFTPVFVFDQFEEVLNLPGSIAWTKKFFDWLESISSDSCPENIIKNVRSIIGDKAAFPAIKEEKDFKAVFSLRKEFIGELDYWGMQKCFIPSLKDNRYCLKALTYEGAKKVMTQQVRFGEVEVEQILTYFVSQYTREPEKIIVENLPVIPALLLSVVCDSWEKDMDAFAELSTVEIGQSLNSILERFYNQSIDAIVHELSLEDSVFNSVQCLYDLETAVFALVDSNGKRVRTKTTNTNLTQIDFDTKYKQILSAHRIIKITKVDDEDYVEIVHDSLCPVIAKRKEMRQAAEAKEREETRLHEQSKKMKRRMAALGIFAIVVIALGALFLWQQRNALMKEREANAYKIQRDSIEELQRIVQSQKEELRNDSFLLASHLLHIQNDSLLLADKNDSLRKQIAINLQQDKTIERLGELTKKTIEHNVAGKLSNRIDPDLKYLLTNLSISGQLNGTDFALLRDMIINGSLKFIDLENAKIVHGGDAYYNTHTIKVDNVIADDLFYGCGRLLGIRLPNSVNTIGEWAFAHCVSLISVNIPNSVTSIGERAFEDCVSLTSVNIPNSVTSIGKWAFGDCVSLTSVNIPDSVTRINKGMFFRCKRLISITIPNSVTSIGEGAFYECERLRSINILGSIRGISDETFKGCSSLTSITIPNSVRYIGFEAFKGCSSLTSINIPDSVTSIYQGTFYGCINLRSIRIPNSVTDIDYEAFKDCAKLASINIPDSVTSIGSYAFSGCRSLTSINIPHSVTSIGNYAFRGCRSLTSINIPDSVTSIGNYAFLECKGLSSVIISNSVKIIGEWAFGECENLRSVIVPNSVTSIGMAAFSRCSNLTCINIPNSVTNIGNSTFNRSGKLIFISQIKDIDKLQIGVNTFGDRDDHAWVVPVGPKGDEDRYVKKYKAQPWWNEKWHIKHESE